MYYGVNCPLIQRDSMEQRCVCVFVLTWHLIKTGSFCKRGHLYSLQLDMVNTANFFPLHLPDILGDRLEKEGKGKLAAQACLCYICSGSVDKLVSCWAQVNQAANSPMSLQVKTAGVTSLNTLHTVQYVPHASFHRSRGLCWEHFSAL